MRFRRARAAQGDSIRRLKRGKAMGVTRLPDRGHTLCGDALSLRDMGRIMRTGLSALVVPGGVGVRAERGQCSDPDVGERYTRCEGKQRRDRRLLPSRPKGFELVNVMPRVRACRSSVCPAGEVRKSHAFLRARCASGAAFIKAMSNGRWLARCAI